MALKKISSRVAIIQGQSPSAVQSGTTSWEQSPLATPTILFEKQSLPKTPNDHDTADEAKLQAEKNSGKQAFYGSQFFGRATPQSPKVVAAALSRDQRMQLHSE